MFQERLPQSFHFFFCFIYRWTLGGQEGKEYYQKDRSGVDVQQASRVGGGGGELYEIMDGGLETLAWF